MTATRLEYSDRDAADAAIRDSVLGSALLGNRRICGGSVWGMASIRRPPEIAVSTKLLPVRAVLMLASLMLLVIAGSVSVPQAMVLVGLVALAFGCGIGFGSALERSQADR
jgi:uncharacterized membrane protein